MSLIKQALDKAEGHHKNDEKKKEDLPENQKSSNKQNILSWRLVSLAVVIIILSAFIGGQFFLLIWLLID